MGVGITTHQPSLQVSTHVSRYHEEVDRLLLLLDR